MQIEFMKIKELDRWMMLTAHNFSGDARTLYNRWKQLRDKYGKEKKKLKYGAEHTGWQYFKHLTFLDPHMIDRQQQQFARAKDGKGVMLSPGGVCILFYWFNCRDINEVESEPLEIGH